MKKLLQVVLCIVLLPLVWISTYIWMIDDAQTTEQTADPEVLANEKGYLNRARAGDTSAGYDLAWAYLLVDSTDERVVSTLRIVARKGDNSVDQLLGTTLLRRQLKRLESGQPVNKEEEREALALLESAVASGKPEAQYGIDEYLRRKAEENRGQTPS